MTLHLAALLAGLFGVPAALLWAGHRLRRRSPLWRAAFWGALAAHLLAAVAATLAGLWPPEAWGPSDLGRGLAGYWALLVGPLLGAGVGALIAARRRADR